MTEFNCYNENYKTFASAYANAQEALHVYGRILYNQGQFQQASAYFNEAILVATRAQQLPQPIDYAMLALTFYAMGNVTSAYEAGKKALQLAPNDCGILSDLGDFSALLGKYEEAISYHKRCFELKPDYSGPLDGLVWSYLHLNNLKEAQHYGSLALQLKDREAFNEKNIAWLLHATNLKNLDYQKEIKKFDPEQSHRNIISFSLWGNNPRYTENAIKNTILAKVIYPGWRCRFYCDDSVDPRVKKKLIENDADIVAAEFKGAFYGLLWRFFVMSDPNVDLFLIRDCDSLLNCQERVAVDEWLESKTCFHLMHDVCTDTELIQGGMLGGVANILPNMQLLIDKFYEKYPRMKGIDQAFLRHCLWPFVKQSYLDHNSFYTFGNSKPFPKLGHFPSGKWHVGQNVGINQKTSLISNPKSMTLWEKLSFF